MTKQTLAAYSLNCTLSRYLQTRAHGRTHSHMGLIVYFLRYYTTQLVKSDKCSFSRQSIAETLEKISTQLATLPPSITSFPRPASWLTGYCQTEKLSHLRDFATDSLKVKADESVVEPAAAPQQFHVRATEERVVKAQHHLVASPSRRLPAHCKSC